MNFVHRYALYLFAWNASCCSPYNCKSVSNTHFYLKDCLYWCM